MTGRARNIAVVALLCLMSRSSAGQASIPPMIGTWQGNAEIRVNWTRASALPIRLTITRDDRVTGVVGEAKLVDAMLLKDPEQGMSYSIEANLIGSIIRKENIWRTSVKIKLDWRDDHFVGDLQTSGWKVGGTERKALLASFTLRREPLRVLCDLEPTTIDTMDPRSPRALDGNERCLMCFQSGTRPLGWRSLR
jgi:hypothetical protein